VPTDVVLRGFDWSEGVLQCEGVRADDLAREFGTPLYVYSRAIIESRYTAFHKAFAALDPLIAYSVKANGNLSVLRILAALGAGADIVSGGELLRAIEAGVPADRIVFSGVGKTRPEMERALELDIGAFNIESAGELRVLAALAAATGREARVAIRVNPDVEATTPHHYTRTGHGTTKFGVPYEEAAELYREAASLPGIAVRGIDVHIGSQIVDPEPYRAAVRRVLGLASTLAAEGIILEFIDVGGGYGVAYDSERGPDASDFARLLVPELEGSGLRVILEPGRFIVGPAGVLLTRVLYVKQMGGKRFVITDAGMNDLLRPSHYSSWHRIDPVRQVRGRESVQVDVVGPVCESGDFLGLDRTIPLPEPDDLLAIGTVGAYGFSMASTYNSRPRPAEVIVEGETARLARRRETWTDLIEPEHGAARSGPPTD
jgi:diaminopimelate decarboxylase